MWAFGWSGRSGTASGARRSAGHWGWAPTLLYLLWHIGQVHQAMPPHPTWHTTSYIQFGGLRFVLATAASRICGFDALPWWITPLALVAALLGAWSAPPVVSLPILGYLTAFAIAGQPFNWYWGWVPGMLLPLSRANDR